MTDFAKDKYNISRGKELIKINQKYIKKKPKNFIIKKTVNQKKI